jgi:hypothetical protein
MPGVQLPGLACHLPPAFARCIRRRRLSQELTVAVQHRITANDNAIRGNLGFQGMRHRIGFCCGQGRGHMPGSRVRVKTRDNGVLIHARDDDERIDSRLAQQLTTAR